MCGILAIASAGRIERTDSLQKRLCAAMERLGRRGPDGRGEHLSPCGRVLLGHTRLAILDLTAAGRQPMVSAGGAVAVTFNGEIYNSPALRLELEQAGARFRSRTDTEVLLHGFAHWGFAGLLSRLVGMYAFVIVDSRGTANGTDLDPERSRSVARGSVTLHAAVDPAGMKPLVWHFDQTSHGTLTIASDCDALRALLADPPGLDGVGLCDVLSIGYCPAPRTVWKGVHKLGPGQAFSWEVGSDRPPRVFSYWLPPEEVVGGEAEGDERFFADLFPRVVADHLLSDVPVGLFLSAGLDSTAVGAALARAGPPLTDRITAFTLSYGSATDETSAAKAAAARLGIEHRSIPLAPADLHETLSRAADAFDEPQGFSALLTATRIARQARESGGPKVVLAGDGGDEALAGYTWHTDRSLVGPMPPAEPGSLASLSYTHRYLCRVFPGFHPAESGALLASLTPGYDAEAFAAWLAPQDRPQLPHPRRAQRLDIMGFCAGSILPKIDRACMAVGLELRAPFLDRRMLDWSLSRGVEASRRQGEEGESKPVLRAYLRKAAADGLVPQSVLTRPKQGFSLRTAEQHPFSAMAEGVVARSRLVRDGVLREDWAAFVPAEPEAREVRLFTLCMLAAWYEKRAG